MEKIKNLLHPGKSQDDEALYGSGSGDATNTNTHTQHGGLTGEGSHFGGTKDTTGLAGQQSSRITNTQGAGTHSNTTAGPHSSDLANKADPRLDSDNSKLTGSGGAYIASGRDEGLGTGGGGGLGQREHQQYASNPSTGNTSGFSNTEGTGAHSTTSSGLHSSNLANKADPRVDSDNSRATGSGTTGGYTSTSGGSYHTGPSGSAVGGPHHSETANRLDPSVNTRGTGLEDARHHDPTHGGGSEEADTHHQGGAADGDLGGAGAAGLASQKYNERETEGDRGVGNTSNISTVGRSTAGHGASSSSDHNYAKEAAIGAGGAGLASHEHNKHQTESGRGIGNASEADRGPGNTSNVGQYTTGDDQYATSSMPGSFPGGPGPAPTTVGPHKYDILNKLDPRVDANPKSVASGSEYRSGNAANPAQSGVQSQERSLGESGHSAVGGIPERTRATNNPHSSAVENRVDPTRDQYNDSTSKDHHYGRDAALTGGAAGFAGATYGAGRHKDESGRGTTSGPLSDSTQSRYASTVGPHSSNLANKADPTVDSDRSKDNGWEGGAGGAGYGTSRQHDTTSTTGPHSSNLANKADPTVDSDRSKDHHYGRDAALVGGAGGLAYGASRQHGADNTSTAGPHDSNLANRTDPRVDSDRSNAGVGSTGYGTSHQTQPQGVTTTTTTNTSTTTSGPHSSNLAHKADPRIDSDRSKDHNYGRDAALVGGAGAGAYGANKLHQGKETAGPHSSDTANKADPTVDSDRSKDHQYGRDAAVAGSAGGAAAYGAHKYNERDEKDIKKAEKEHERQVKEAEKDRKHAEKEAEKDHKHAEKQAEKDRKHAEKEHEKAEKKEHKGGLLSFLHRDKSKKYSKEEEDEFDRQEREQESHKGRDTALGAGAGAAVGGAAYATHQHHSGHNTTDADTEKPLPTAPGNHGIGTGAGTQNALADDSTTRHGDHTTSSATGNHGPTSEAEKPPGTTIGDKLHGVERNRGIPGPTGFPDETLGEHNTDQHGNPIRGSTSGQHSGVGVDDSSHDHHTSRNATLAGGAGAGAGAVGALGAHEHQKRDNMTSGQQSGRTGHQYDNTQGSAIGSGQQSGVGSGDHSTTSRQHDGSASGLGLGAGSGAGALGANEHRQRQVETAAASNQHGSVHTGSDNSRDHHTGRDAALVGGGAGAGALGAHEYSKHDATTSGPQSGLACGQYDNTQGSGVGSGQQSGLTGQHSDNSNPQGTGLISSQYQDTSRNTGPLSSSDDNYRQPGSAQTSGLGSSGYDDSSRQIGGVAGSSQPNDSTNNGRNRLHKDPPANHPASKIGGSGGESHVPASGTERQRIMGQGEDRLDDDSGVKNSHAVDEARNY